MIDLKNETIMSMAEAARRLPPRSARHRHAHVATLHRWASRGVRGVRLETVRLGGMRVTSVEALQRFAEQVTAADSRESQYSGTEIGRGAARAAGELSKLGI